MPPVAAFAAAVVSSVGSAVGAIGGALGLGGAATAYTVDGLAVSTIGAPIGGGILGGITGGSLLAEGVKFGVLTAASELAGLIGGTAKPPAVGASAGQPSAVDFKADPTAAIPYVMGRTAVGGNIVFAQTSNDGKNTYLNYMTVISGGGPIDAFEDFLANGVSVPFSGNAATGNYASRMWMDWRLGAQPDTAVGIGTTIGGGNSLPEWTSSNKLSGYACTAWDLMADTAIYPNGTPTPLWVVRGVKAYDPRLDSTYPGGSGSQRSFDETTWTYTQNPALHALTFCLGRFQNGVKIVGIGAPIGLIDTPAFVNAANVADANTWRVGGQITTADDKWSALTSILQAGGATPVRAGSMISCTVNAPIASIATIDQSDIVGAWTVPACQSQRTRINGIAPSYRSEGNTWQMVPAGIIHVADYITADGGETRTPEVTFDLVQAPLQAAQLGAYMVVNAREFGPVVIPCKPKHMGLKPGDGVTVNAAELGLESQLCRVVERSFDPATGMVTLNLASETTAKHAFALGQSASPPPAPSLRGVDLSSVPAPGVSAWAVSGSYVDDGAGAQVPDIVISGACDLAFADAIVFEYERIGEGVLHALPFARPDSTGTIITGVLPGESYEVAVSYIVRGVQGARRILGPVGPGGYISPSNDSISPSHLQIDSVITDKIALYNVTDPNLAQAAPGWAGSGIGTWGAAISDTLNLTADGFIELTGFITQSFSHTPCAWSFRLQIDGSVVAQGGGTVAGDTATIVGGGAYAAGTHSVELDWYGDTLGITLVTAALMIDISYR